MTFTIFRLLPPLEKELDLLVASDQRRLARPEGLETALDGAFPQNPPRPNRRGEPLQFSDAEILILEESRQQLVRALRDDHGAWLGKCLQPGGKIGRFAHDRLFLRCTGTDKIANDDQSGRNAYSHLKRHRCRQLFDRADEGKPRLHRTLDVIFLRAGIAEVNEYAVAHVLRDKAAEAGNSLGDATVIGADHFSEILGIHARRECRRSHEVAEHYCELAAFGASRSRIQEVVSQEGTTAGRHSGSLSLAYAPCVGGV